MKDKIMFNFTLWLYVIGVTCIGISLDINALSWKGFAFYFGFALLRTCWVDRDER